MMADAYRSGVVFTLLFEMLYNFLSIEKKEEHDEISKKQTTSLCSQHQNSLNESLNEVQIGESWEEKCRLVKTKHTIK